MDIGIIYYGLAVLLIIATRFGLFKLFEIAAKTDPKALQEIDPQEIKPWAAFVPIYGEYMWLKIIGKPLWWLILILIPIVRTLVTLSMRIELMRAYGRYEFGPQALAVLFPFFYFPVLGTKADTSYLGPASTHKKIPTKSGLREWADAFLFAGVAALIIRTLFIEAFMIPTTSMERSLMAGDFLFVSKFHYGSRLPMAPLSVPFVHNKIFGNKSYLGFVELPYFRLPGLTEVKRNDIVVFNYPAHDISALNDGIGTVEEISMKENYIKRCVAVGGDTVQVKEGDLYINGKPAYEPLGMQHEYEVVVTQAINENMYENTLRGMGFRSDNNPSTATNINWYYAHGNVYVFHCPEDVAKELEKLDFVKSVRRLLSPKGETSRGLIYPKKPAYPFNVDNFGPLAIPKKGQTIKLTQRNVDMYRRVIEAYENHTMEIKGGKAYIDGEETETYSFEMNYYFMMGDNRHNSEDSRVWGFVPENHIVGKPLFIFFSYESDFGARFGRIGTKNLN